MSAVTSELRSNLIDMEQVSTELDSLNTLLAYLTSELDSGAAAVSDDAVKAIAFTRRAATFCKMIYAVNTGMSRLCPAKQ